MKKIISLIAGILIFISLVSIYSYHRGISRSASSRGQDIEFTIKKGESVKEISQRLFNKNLISSKLYFEIYIWRTNNESNIQAGKYVLNPILSIKEIADIFIKGRVADEEEAVTIIEGWNISDIGQYLEKKGLAKSEYFLQTVGFPKIDYRQHPEINYPKDYSAEFDFLKDKPKYYSLEGYLFPDTYRVYKDFKVDSLIFKMLSNFGKKLDIKMRQDIKEQRKTINQIIIMASLLEKEVKSEEDMKVVSGIFWKRIRNGQPLESCATLAYALGVNKKQYSSQDTKIASPYNTYLHKGLPPAPICNPGLNAIKAAIYPQESSYNYFLSDPKSGKTVFSKTYQEHLKNKRNYFK